MTEIDDLDRHTLLAQRHRHRREDERRRRVTGQIRFLQFRPAVEAKGLEKTFACDLFVDEVGDRTREMTRHRKKPDPEFLLIAGGRTFRTEKMKINRHVKERDERQPDGSDND